jgi:hypothetical protein
MDTDQSIMMEQEDFLRLKDCEILSLREELVRERARREAAESEADLSFQQMQELARDNVKMRQQINSWTREADEQAAMRQQLERQGYEE